MAISTFLIRTVGLGGAALVGYDTLKMSQRRAMYETRDEISGDLTDILVKNTVNGNGSQLTENMKKRYMKWRMDDNLIPTLEYAKNRVGSTIEAVTLNVAGLGLALCALGAKSSSKWRGYKGFIPKPVAGVAAIALGVLGVANFSKNVLGIGQDNPMKL